MNTTLEQRLEAAVQEHYRCVFLQRDRDDGGGSAPIEAIVDF